MILNLHPLSRRFPMDEVPATQEELNSYCYKLFERKVSK